MALNLKVEKGIPLPKKSGGVKKGSRWSVLWQMEPGDSVFLPDRSLRNVSSLVNNQRKEGWKFKFRTITENGTNGVRIWRVA